MRHRVRFETPEHFHFSEVHFNQNEKKNFSRSEARMARIKKIYEKKSRVILRSPKMISRFSNFSSKCDWRSRVESRH